MIGVLLKCLSGIFPLWSKDHWSSVQLSFHFRTNAIEIRFNHLPAFVQIPSMFGSTISPLSSKCHRNSVQPPFLFHANAGEQFFRFRWIVLLKPFGCSSNSLVALLLISFLILLRLFRLLSVAEGRWGGGARGTVKQADERCGKGALFYWHHKNTRAKQYRSPLCRWMHSRQFWFCYFLVLITSKR